MDLASLIEKRTVKIPLAGFDKEEVIAELVELLVRAGKVRDRDAVMTALLEREKKGTTGIGGGVAIPHAKYAGVQGVELAIGVSPKGIEFDAADDALVHLVFLVVGEARNPGPNVAVLATIGRLMQMRDVYENMVSARDADELTEAIHKVQVER